LIRSGTLVATSAAIHPPIEQPQVLLDKVLAFLNA